MAEQSFKSHTRFDPPWHFFLAPVALITLISAVVATVRRWPMHPWHHIWSIVLGLAFCVAVFVTRRNMLKVQDRVIRLEERIRMSHLLPPDDLLASHALTMQQIIALRFASDLELTSLVRRTLKENLDPKAIKAAIVNWRTDDYRV